MVKNALAGSVLWAGLVGMGMSSCSLFEKKEDENPVPDNTVVYGDTLVLKTGKGFSQLAILPGVFTGGANGAFLDGVDVVDMTLDRDGQRLHVATVSTLTTQQDPLRSLRRYSLDASTGAFLTPPSSDLKELGSKAYSSEQLAVVPKSFGFRPGTSQFYAGSLVYNSFGVATASVSGDVQYSRINTFAQMPRVTANGEVLENVFSEGNPRIDGLVNQRIFSGCRLANGTALELSYTKPIAGQKNIIRIGQMEPKALNSNTFYYFAASEIQLYAIEVTIPYALATASFRFIDSLALPAGYLTTHLTTRPADDGSRFGILLWNGGVDNKLMSARFDVATQKLALNMDKIQIPGFGTGPINFDLDDEGNLYFDNWANNFQSDSTISIYKASGSGFTVLGDDLIKSGSIRMVRWYKGKVYAAVAYKIQGSNTLPQFRIAVIRQ
jgi:hypothetical protein